MNRAFKVLAIFAIGFCFSGSPQEKRLIQHLDTGKVEWMTRSQVYEMALNSRVPGVMFVDITDHPGQQLAMAPVVAPIDFDKLVIKQQARVKSLTDYLSADALKEKSIALEKVGIKYYDSAVGAAGAKWVYDQFVAMAKGRADVTVNYFKHKFQQSSVVATIAGKGPKAAERIVIGGHQDSIGGPGADDDGSGTITVIEVFRALMEGNFVPSRTIEFHAYAGEEGGLLGSADIAKDYKAKAVPVVAMLQFDMTMFTNNGANSTVQLVTGRSHPALTNFLEKLFATYSAVPTKRVGSVGGATDSFSWTANGYAAAWPFEPVFNSSLHTPKDTYEKMDFPFGVNFAKVGVAFAVEISEAE